MTQRKRLLYSFIFFFVFCGAIFFSALFFYKKDKNQYEPKLWIGFFDYRLNLRDVGASLNACLNKNLFATGLFYRSNKYFSGWSCDKIQNPQNIYSLNYSPNHPHSYFCYEKDGTRLRGFHPNTTFEISDIENLQNWKTPAFRDALCTFFQKTLYDMAHKSRFLVHCDVGRDRTGAFTALFAMMMAEAAGLDSAQITDAIECDYEKTSALEPFKKGRMKKFMVEMEQSGGVSHFIENTCGIQPLLIQDAARQFVNNGSFP